MTGECKIEGCENRHFSGGWCSKHYTRWQRGQALDNKSQYEKSLHERFWEKVYKRPGNGCWLWTGSKNKKGYGHFRVSNSGKTVVYKAHRWSWEEANGMIEPADLTIDHVVCEQTDCVRPSHMELVTRAENTRRARQRKNTAA